MDRLLNVCCISYRAGGRRILRDISLTLDRGEILGIAGESGSGKSTLAKILSGVISPERGSITPEPDLSRDTYPVTGRDICMVPQNSMNSFNPSMKMGKQLTEGIILQRGVSKKDAVRRALKLMKEFSLHPSTYSSYPHELSGGMKQRFAFLMGILPDPDILILDEISTGLDPLNRELLIKKVKTLKKDRGIILITHDLDLIQETCDRVIILKEGLPVEWGDTSDVLNLPRHPYVRELIASRIENLPEKILPLKKMREYNSRECCPYIEYCPYAMKVCTRGTVFSEISSAGGVACWKFFSKEG